jgi:hypothetical protein
MKKNLLSILTALTIASSVAVAQPTLTSANTNPVSGDMLTLQSYSYIASGGSGANQTWNFTSITQTTNAAIAYTFAAVTASNVSTFPNANQQFSSGGATAFNNTSATALQYYGSKQGTVSVVYSNPEDQMHYPFTMGNSYTDPFHATYTNGGYNYVRRGSTAVNADAYGMLQLPGGTFSNVLRVHFVQTYQDSTYFTGIGPYIITYVNDEYMWYLPNNHMPVFSTYSLTLGIPSSGPQTATGSNKLVTILSGINEQANAIKSLNFYPNPASNGLLNLDLNLNETLKYQVIIIDNLGREVLRSNSENGFAGYNFKTFDISKIASGLYSFEITSDNMPLVAKKIIINN